MPVRVILKRGFAPLIGILIVGALLAGLSATLKVTQKPLETKSSAATQGEVCNPAGARCIDNWAWWCYTDSRGLDRGTHPCTCDNINLSCWNEAPGSPPPAGGDPNVCESGGSTATVCYGRAVNSACNGFPGTCVRNGNGANGYAACGCYTGVTPVASTPTNRPPAPPPPDPTYAPPAGATSTPRPLSTSTPRPTSTSAPIPTSTRVPTVMPSPTRIPTATVVPFATSTPIPGVICPSDIWQSVEACYGRRLGEACQTAIPGQSCQDTNSDPNALYCSCLTTAQGGMVRIPSPTPGNGSGRLVTLTSTPRPTATPTRRLSATPTRRPTATPTPRATIGLRCGIGGVTCSSDQYCGFTTGVCQWKHSAGKGCTRDEQCKSGQCDGWIFVNRVCK